jgi:hypothetical protein
MSRFTIFSVVVFPEPDPPGDFQRETIDRCHLAVPSCEIQSLDHVEMVPQSIGDLMIIDCGFVDDC